MQPLGAWQDSPEHNKMRQETSSAVIWYLQAKIWGVFWFGFFSLVTCWICSVKDLTWQRRKKKKIQLDLVEESLWEAGAELAISETSQGEGMQRSSCTALMGRQPSWGGEDQTGWLKWKIKAKLRCLPPLKESLAQIIVSLASLRWSLWASKDNWGNFPAAAVNATTLDNYPSSV